jgi:hypothetical protein
LGKNQKVFHLSLFTPPSNFFELLGLHSSHTMPIPLTRVLALTLAITVAAPLLLPLSRRRPASLCGAIGHGGVAGGQDLGESVNKDEEPPSPSFEGAVAANQILGFPVASASEE